MGRPKKPKSTEKRNRFWWWIANPEVAIGMTIADRQQEAESGFRKRRVWRRFSPWWSLGLLLLCTLLYEVRSDSTYAITVWPAWIGWVIGMVLTFRSRKWQVLLASFWTLFGLHNIDELKSYPRMLLPVPPHQLRVVGLNCAGGTVEAAEEVAAQKPDIVFFQESCSKHELAVLARKFFGEKGVFLSSPDASIVARGTLSPIATTKGTNDFVAAHWEDGSGHELTLVSLRLLPPVMRIDLFSPSAWTDFAQNRSARRLQTERMAGEFVKKGISPDLLGGDFNTPPDPGSLDAITRGLGDSFQEKGVGYGATCVNPFPCLVRIDQLWHSAKLKPTRSRVVKTVNSDHRMLVTDFNWP